MRQTQNPQFKFAQVEISQIKISTKSRDDAPKFLRGIQHLCQNEYNNNIVGQIEIIDEFF